MCHGWKAKDEIKAKRFVCAAWKFPGGVEVFALRQFITKHYFLKANELAPN